MFKTTELLKICWMLFTYTSITTLSKNLQPQNIIPRESTWFVIHWFMKLSFTSQDSSTVIVSMILFDIVFHFHYRMMCCLSVTYLERNKWMYQMQIKKHFRKKPTIQYVIIFYFVYVDTCKQQN